MFDRCGEQTRYRRWHGHSHRFPSAYLESLLSESDEHIAVAAVRGTEVVGIGSAAIESDSIS